VEFADPADPAQVVRADLTWLTSRWTCIFGRGCRGVDADRPDDGCCTHGAHFSEDEDRLRVARWVAELGPDGWEQHAAAVEAGWTETDDEGGTKTRVVDGVCIFFNSRGFPGGYGCALHNLADRGGIGFVQTKPDVCWQLPLRREYDWRTERDGSEVLVLTLTEYTRGAWGEGGHDFDWYCSSSTDAHTGTEPVYRSAAAEILELIGPAAAAVLQEHCEAFETEQDSRRRRSLPLLVVHPASRVGPLA
jgi:hypothetical protein